MKPSKSISTFYVVPVFFEKKIENTCFGAIFISYMDSQNFSLSDYPRNPRNPSEPAEPAKNEPRLAARARKILHDYHFSLERTQKRPVKRANLLHIRIWISK
jgi:hypothetical protein